MIHELSRRFIDDQRTGPDKTKPDMGMLLDSLGLGRTRKPPAPVTYSPLKAYGTGAAIVALYALVLWLILCATGGAEERYPVTPAEAAAMKEAGATWSNQEIRAYYLRFISDPSPQYAARRAFAIRHNARLTARVMMADESEVAALEQRDRAKYGQPDGPTFAQLGSDWQAIIESSKRTDEATNERFSDANHQNNRDQAGAGRTGTPSPALRQASSGVPTDAAQPDTGVAETNREERSILKEVNAAPVHGAFSSAYGAALRNGLPLVVAVAGDNCPHCPGAKTARARVWQKLTRMNFAELDLERDAAICKALKVDRIPCLVVCTQVDGKWHLERVYGADAKRIEAAVDAALTEVVCRCGCGKRGCCCNSSPEDAT